MVQYFPDGTGRDSYIHRDPKPLVGTNYKPKQPYDENSNRFYQESANSRAVKTPIQVLPHPHANLYPSVSAASASYTDATPTKSSAVLHTPPGYAGHVPLVREYFGRSRTRLVAEIHGGANNDVVSSSPAGSRTSYSPFVQSFEELPRSIQSLQRTASPTKTTRSIASPTKTRGQTAFNEPISGYTGHQPRTAPYTPPEQ